MSLNFLIGYHKSRFSVFENTITSNVDVVLILVLKISEVIVEFPNLWAKHINIQSLLLRVM